MSHENLEPDSLTDRQLLARYLKANDEAAFGILVGRHQPMVLGVCYQLLGHRQDAEDACQATFLVLAKDARRIRRPNAIANWLYGVAYRVSLRLRRRRVRTMTVELEETTVNPCVAPLDQLTRQYQCGVTHDELAKLPNRLRTPMVLRYLAGMSNKQVADQLGISESAVEGRLKRAKAKLRVSLTRHGLTWALALAVFESTRSDALAAEPSGLLQQTVDKCLSCDGTSNGSEKVFELAQQEIVAMTTANAIKALGVGGVALCVAVLSMSVHRQGSTARASDLFEQDKNVVQVDSPFAETPTAKSRGRLTIAEDPFAPPADAQAADPSAPRAAAEGPFALSEERPSPGGAAEDPFAAPESSPNPASISSNARPLMRHAFDRSRSNLERKIEHELENPTNLSFVETPLDEMTVYLASLHDIQIFIDERGLDKAGMSADMPISLELSGVSLRSALNLVMRQAELDYMIRDDVLMITTPEVVESTTETRVYSLDPKWGVDGNVLREIVLTSIQPSSWQEVGGEGFIAVIKHGMVIRQSYHAHVEIADLLDQLSTAAEINQAERK